MICGDFRVEESVEYFDRQRNVSVEPYRIVFIQKGIEGRFFPSMTVRGEVWDEEYDRSGNDAARILWDRHVKEVEDQWHYDEVWTEDIPEGVVDGNLIKVGDTISARLDEDFDAEISIERLYRKHDGRVYAEGTAKVSACIGHLIQE